MDEIIDREQRGEATPAELRQLAEWRRSSLANEHEYRRVVRMLTAARTLLTALPTETPSAASVLARRRNQAAEPERRRMGWMPWLVGAAAAAGLITGFVLPRRNAPAQQPAWGLADIATGAAEMTTVQLGDGSVVRLAPSSRLRMTASDTAREVTLDGRAFFVVAKAPDRPFVVHTSAGNTRVLGTRFELSTSEGNLNLVVVEGRVVLSAGNDNVEVRGGQQSGVRDQRTLPPTPVVDAERMEQWVGKFLVFHSTPVRDVAREIERMYGVRVIAADSVLSRRTVTATFTDRTAEQVLDVICSVVNARCESRPGEMVMSRR